MKTIDIDWNTISMQECFWHKMWDVQGDNTNPAMQHHVLFHASCLNSPVTSVSSECFCNTDKCVCVMVRLCTISAFVQNSTSLYLHGYYLKWVVRRWSSGWWSFRSPSVKQLDVFDKGQPPCFNICKRGNTLYIKGELMAIPSPVCGHQNRATFVQTEPCVFIRRPVDTSSRICGDHNKYFKPNNDLLLTLTKCFVCCCVFLPKPNHGISTSKTEPKET